MATQTLSFIAIVEAPPLGAHNQTSALLAHAKSALSDVPIGTWIRILDSNEHKVCSNCQSALTRHKASGRVPKNLKAKVVDMGGRYSLFVRYAPEKES